jgi:hypothetical protein
MTGLADSNPSSGCVDLESHRPACGNRRSPDYEKGRERGGVPSSQPPHLTSRPCPVCRGLGLSGERDEWGIGKPCPKCDGTGKA